VSNSERSREEKRYAGTHQYKYNGKELQTELGLNVYDYGARNYDPALGRYMNFDFFTEKFENKTPYHYVSNNPTNKVDLGGHYELSVKDQKKYKALTNYLKNGISEILSNSTIMNGLMKYGGFTEQQIKDKIVKFGQGSIKLEISGDIISNGQYPNPAKDASIYVNKILAEQIENATTDEERELAILAFLTTTLHETVHYGDNTFREENINQKKAWEFIYSDGQPINEYELGFAFEAEAFWDGNYGLFEDNKGSKSGKEGLDSMKRLVRNKVNNKNIKSLPKNIQEIITNLQNENPDAEIFIIE
jgi:RHS repeat-associated protein